MAQNFTINYSGDEINTLLSRANTQLPASAGSNGQVLSISGTSPVWATPANTWRPIAVHSAPFLSDSSTTLNFIAGSNISLSSATTGALTISASVPTYTLATTVSPGLMPQLATATITTPTAGDQFLRADGSWATPSIPSSQVNSDWDISDTSDVRCILNKPELPSSYVTSIASTTGALTLDASLKMTSATMGLSGKLPYTTTAPTTANTSGFLSIVHLTSTPTNPLDGYLYIVTTTPSN